MRNYLIGFLAVAVAGLVALSLHRLTGQDGPPLYLSYGAGYALFAVMLLMTLRKTRPNWHPAMQRMASLLAGAGLAVLDVTISGLKGEMAQQAFFSALLGVALVQVVAKMLDRKSINRD